MWRLLLVHPRHGVTKSKKPVTFLKKRRMGSDAMVTTGEGLADPSQLYTARISGSGLNSLFETKKATILPYKFSTLHEISDSTTYHVLASVPTLKQQKVTQKTLGQYEQDTLLIQHTTRTI